MYRKTFAYIDGNVLKNNVTDILSKYNDYKYYIGVVKNNAYGHGIYTINDLIAGGINYLAVSSLEEALDARKYNSDIPILVLEPIDSEYIYDAINNGITITIDSLERMKEIVKVDLRDNLKVHLKIDSGMNRLGIKTSEELDKTIGLFKKNERLIFEGIYSHFATSGISDSYWDTQLLNFKNITKNVDLSEVPIVHMGRSLTLVNHPKIDFCNGIRLGIVMYGFAQNIKKGNILHEIKQNYLISKYKISPTTRENDLQLSTVFSLYTEVMAIRKVAPGEKVGYGSSFVSKEEAYIATLPIGYADGINKKWGSVYIKGRAWPIVADSMDMIMVKVDENIRLKDKVELLGEHIKVRDVCNNLGVNAYHLFNQISNRVPRIHKRDSYEEEVKY